MAVTITTFNYPTTPAGNIDEVYDWLTTNAASYFPGGIVKDTDTMRILCYPIEGDTIVCIGIPFYNNTPDSVGYIHAKYATTTQAVCPNGNQYTNGAYRKAAITSCGFMLMAHASGACWSVTRTTDGSVCTFCYGSPSYAGNMSSFYAWFTDLENGTDYARLNTTGSVGQIVSANRYIIEGQTTSLLPIVFPGGSHTTNMFMTHFTQSGMSANFDSVLIDGQEYVYDGFIALKG